LKELGIEKLRRHDGSQYDPKFFDYIGLSFGDPSFNNLILVDSAIQAGHPNAEQLKPI
jgi:hypothetical protein